MSYAILQLTAQAPAVEQLQRAFRGHATIASADACLVARAAYGLLARGLEREEACSIQAALAREGVPAEAVAEEDLPSLPLAKQVHRLDCLPDALHVFDPLGRPFPVPWGHLRVVAVGVIGDSSELVLELVLSGGVARYRTTAERCLYPYLGERRRPRWSENFPLLVEDLFTRAPHALPNRGAHGLRRQPGMTYVYPTKREYLEELTWLLWRLGRPR